ncbi:MAG: response regulator [Polyangiaceae bacterium]|nr:response regulator [Polyangiaceae bacterium]
MTSPARVLVIDDSPTILKVVSSILARHGYDPVTARDGVAGLELIKRGPQYDLVLLDFVMPRMNGYQFCRELRSNPAHRTLPVVLMSAKGDKIRGTFVQQTGAVDAITKPFDARALVTVVEGALSKTADGRSRPTPEGEKMPEDLPPADSLVRPSVMMRHARQRAGAEFAQQVSNAIVPAILALSPEDRANEAAVMSAIARTMTNDVLASLSLVLKDFDLSDGVREAMSGDLAAVPLAEMLQVLAMQRQTGVLHVTNNRSSVIISVRQGQVDFVQARGSSDEYRLGRYFIEKGSLTREQLDDLLAQLRGASKLLGETLVDRNIITRDELVECLSKQCSELIYDMLRWPYGRFSFTKEPFRPEADMARLALNVSGLVLEGFRRVDEWRLMENTINFDQVPVIDPLALQNLAPDQLKRTEKLVLDAVDGRRTVRDIIKLTAVSSFDCVKIIYLFLQSMVLRIQN